MKLAVVGLGYVGLPLATELGKHFATVGYDIKTDLIAHYRNGYDPTGEISSELFTSAKHLSFTDDVADLSACDIYIIAVPTPVNEAKQPDLSPLKSASETVASVITKGNIVVYESTVFPGATEDICVPILEKGSGLKWLVDFNVGYSPERINPSDKERTLTKIVKVVSADSEASLDKVTELYSRIIDAGVYRVPSIKVAEAAKVIENTQRDINIAFVNELAIIFDRMNIDTRSVLEAASTKWNFLKFSPGLVGGHCIGVDPYYLTSKAESLGYSPEVILAGRRINDGMSKFIAEKTAKQLFSNGFSGKAKVAVYGLTFKENCSDLRNSQVKHIVDELTEYQFDVSVCDPVADQVQARQYYDIDLAPCESIGKSDAIILAVPHQQFADFGVEYFSEKLNDNGVFIDVKSIFSADDFAHKTVSYWAL